MALGEQRGIWLPSYDTVDPADGPSVGAAVAAGRPGWGTIAPADMREFDFILMRSVLRVRGKLVSAEVHFGLAAPRRFILHMQEGGSSVLQPFASLQHRVIEILRHKGLA